MRCRKTLTVYLMFFTVGMECIEHSSGVRPIFVKQRLAKAITI